MLIDFFPHNARAILVSSNITFYYFRDLINDKSHALAAILFFEIIFLFFRMLQQMILYLKGNLYYKIMHR